MELVGVVFLMLFMLVQVNSAPGHTHHHVHHRIHVPHKVKTVYHTKIIKVPEHHHYYHEKEKIVPVEVHKEEPIYPPLKEEDFGEISHHHSLYGSEHNILKKHAPAYSKESHKRKVLSKIK
uniref:Histidine-rich glycoprotein-like n=1 Tax=Diabrotica virgifera virgifera TaxID=50390 RepID=A0A6P7GG71_DIAVI